MDRNMVSNAKGIVAKWDVAKKENVLWVQALGSQTYGNPTVAHGQIYVGTNNEGVRDPKQPGDRGVLMAFRTSDGEFLWQHTNEKLAAGRVNDWPFQGVCSSPSRRRRHPLLRVQPLRDRRPRHQRFQGQARTTARSRTRKFKGEKRRRCPLEVRHDGRGRRLPAQHGQLLARLLRRPPHRHDRQRPG
jgi:hypothetical protein